MADGNFAQNIAEDGTITYKSEAIEGALTIKTTYDADFNVIATEISRAYGNIRGLEDMPADFQRAWDAVKDNLPASFTAAGQVLQFGDDRGNLVVIATKDLGDVANGDVLGRINKWSNEGNEGSWSRWVNNEVIDAQNSEWSYNFHDADWNRVAEYGEREINLVVDGGLILDETGVRSTSFVHKSATDEATWQAITDTVTVEQLNAINVGGVTWADVDYVEVQQNSWEAIENLYRDADQLWSDSEEQMLIHGKIGDDTNTVFIGSISKRDGFIVIRDNNWNEVARLTDPETALTYAEVKEIYGSAFETAWAKVGPSLPSSFKDEDGNTVETTLLYNIDKWGNVMVFDADGVMIGEISTWGHSDTWERPWDDDYPSQTHQNVNFGFSVIETTDGGDTWTHIGNYGEGKNTFHPANGGDDLLDNSWSNVSSTIYERKVSEADWASLEAVYLSEVVAKNLDITWEDVDKLEVFDNTNTNYPNQWRDTTETNQNEGVRFFSEVSMNDGSWYAQQFLGGAEKRGGFIEIYDADWNTVARVADPDFLLAWQEVISEQTGLEQAWSDVKAFLPTEIKDPTQLKFTTDDNNIYAFTAAGVMAAQINYWNDVGQWDGWFDGQVLPQKNIHYNYNFHDADWNNIANAGGFDRYIVEEDGNLVHDETGTNIGVQIFKDDTPAIIWDEYDPDVPTIIWENITEIRYQTDTWQSISNEYRNDDWTGTNSNTRIEFFDEVEGHNWAQFVGAVEQRDGYIEIRDENWNVIEQRIDPEASALETSYMAMVTKYGSAFSDAWVAVADMLPSVFKDEDGVTNEKNFLYTSDRWDNILVFSSNGKMIGEIGYWSNENTWDRSWDKDYTSETQHHENFNFRILDDSSGSRDTIDVARYEVGSNDLIDNAGKATTDRDWTQVSSTLIERFMSSEDWAQAEEQLFNNKITELLGFTWEDVDKVETGTRERTEYAVRWRTEDETSTEKQIEFIREIEMNDGAWYAHDLLGSIQYRDGFIEIRDADWNTVGRIVDASNALSFDEILAENPDLDWAWDQVKYYLPDAAQDRTALTFTLSGKYDPIAVFDSSGAMILQISRWDWEETSDFDGVTEYAYGNGYNFQDENWNRYAQADRNERYVSDAINEPALDHVWESVSSTIRKSDLSAEAWEKFNPNDTTGTIIWDDVVELSVGVNEWQSYANFNRDSDNIYSGDEERVEYFIEVGDAWSTWTERVGTTERQGNLLTIFDNDWNRVDQIVYGDVTGQPLRTIFEGPDLEIINEYGEIIAKYLDIDALEIIMSSSGDAILVEDGKIVATVDKWEEFWDGGEFYFNYSFRDTQGDNILRLGGWNYLDENDEPIAKPNGVQIGEYLYRDKMTDEEWAQVEADYGITWEGFNWDTVGVVEKRMWRNDRDGDGTYDERQEVQFIQVDENTGRQNWDYFNATFDGPIVTVKDGNWDTLGSYVREGAGLVQITDLNDFSAGFLGLVNDTAVLDGHFASGALSYFKDEDTGKLLIVGPQGDVRVVVDDVTEAWSASFGDTQLGYELRRPDDSYIGWLWKSDVSTAENPLTDSEGNIFEGATKIASNMFFYPGSEQLSSQAWAFLNTVFKPVYGTAEHEFYDLSQATMRLEEWVDGSGNTVGKNVLIQHNLPGVDGWTIRTGFDLINGNAITIKNGDASGEPVVEESYLDMAKVQAGIDAFIKHAFYYEDFPDDLGILDYYFVEQPILQLEVNAFLYGDAESSLMAAYFGSSLVEDTSFSEDMATFTFEATDGVTAHKASITSTYVGFGEILDTYIDNMNIGLDELLYDLEGTIADALGETDLDETQYSVVYSYDADDEDNTFYDVLAYDVSDAGMIWNYEPISSRSDDMPFLVNLMSGGGDLMFVNFHTADDAISVDVQGLDQIATDILEFGGASNQEEANQIALEEFMTDFLLAAFEPDPMDQLLEMGAA